MPHIKIHAGFIVALLLILPAITFAASTYIVKSGDTLRKIAAANHIGFSQLVAYNPQIKNINLIYPKETIYLSAASAAAPAPKTAIPAPAVSTSVNISQVGESRFVAYTTGYGWPDNTPKGSAQISDPIVHSLAGGTGTYQNPITLAVGHTITGGKDILDYPAGTKFYIPNLRKYFIVEDTCGDGNAPQNGPCHTGYKGNVWLDLWVGGNSSNQTQTLKCEDAITDTHLVIKNPASNYAVVAGDVASGCKQYGDAVVAQ